MEEQKSEDEDEDEEEKVEHKMLSMPADLVLNLIYGNAACSTYFCLLNATPRHAILVLFDSRKVCQVGSTCGPNRPNR